MIMATQKLFFILVIIFSFTCNSDASQKSEWKKTNSKHFSIFYKNSPIEFLKTVEESAEEYYEKITKQFGMRRYTEWTWDKRSKIYIYDNAAHYKKEGQFPEWSGGVTFTKERVIETFPTASGFFDTTLPHELAHIIFREFIGHKVNLPIWFEEGIAMYNEKAKRWGADQKIREAIKDGSFVPLPKLSRLRTKRNPTNKEIGLFYLESASIVQYMINTLGTSKFIRFCNTITKLNSFENAIDSRFGRIDTIEELNESWVKYLNSK